MTLGIDEKIKGVNLGNWLVLEKWMSPALFDECGEEDEIWMHRTLSADRLTETLSEHREAYMTIDDFRNIAAHGCNLVRLPVPYFVFGDIKGHPGCVEYVDRAFDWAERTGLKVMLDLHTVPGSQNGYDNGGITGVCKWAKSPKAVEYSLTVLERLAKRYRGRASFWGMEVVNEPISWIVYATAPSTGHAKNKAEARGSGYVPMRFLKSFYCEAYRRLRRILRDETVIVFHDGFRLNAWGDWFARKGMRNVMLDTHIYLGAVESFVPFRTMWVYKTYVKCCEWAIKRAARHTPVIVGEWNVVNSLAMREGVNKSDVYGKILELELPAWNASAGCIYWNYQLLRGRSDVTPTHYCTADSLEAWDLSLMWSRGWIGGAAE